MKVRIFYQDFEINAMCFDKESLAVFPTRAVFITEMDSKDTEDRWSFPELVEYGDFAGVVWELMNLNPHEAIGKENIHRFAEVGHTSMSVGDYIEWMDGTIWVAGPCGWKITTRCKVCNANERCIREFQDCQYCLANVVKK